MFATPRPKKSILPPLPSKKRKAASAVEEIAFDNDARHEFLTGFHKRKLQRIKHAQEQAAKQARQERLEFRRQVRQDRRREVEQHAETVNRMLRGSGSAANPAESGSSDEGEGDDEWDGFPDKPDLQMIDHEEEYIDEDHYTTVTVESVTVSRDGLHKPQALDETEDDNGQHRTCEADTETQKKKTRPTRSKKKTFRYESKVERQLTNRKQRARSRRQK